MSRRSTADSGSGPGLRRRKGSRAYDWLSSRIGSGCGWIVMLSRPRKKKKEKKLPCWQPGILCGVFPTPWGAVYPYFRCCFFSVLLLGISVLLFSLLSCPTRDSAFFVDGAIRTIRSAAWCGVILVMWVFVCFLAQQRRRIAPSRRRIAPSRGKRPCEPQKNTNFLVSVACGFSRFCCHFV